MFIETWHTYSLTEESLGPVAADLLHELAEWVLRMGENPKDMPEWGVLCPPMGENDPRVYFRQLEVAVGYTFSILAAADVLGLGGPVVSMIDAGSVSGVKKQLRALNPGIFWEKERRRTSPSPVRDRRGWPEEEHTARQRPLPRSA